MIYILEDDSTIRDLVVYTLNHMGMEAKGFEKPSLFWSAIAKEIPELLLLDVMLPEEDGITVLEKLRSDNRYEKLPVIMLTAKNTEYDKVLGLDKGADDYVAKPFGMMELVARIKALLRRSKGTTKMNDGANDTEKLTVGSIDLYSDKHIVKVEGERINLTLKEYELLHMLMNNKGIVLNRDKLLNNIWGYQFDGESRTVDVHIRTLRTKLKTAGNLIETVRGVGYKIGEE